MAGDMNTPNGRGTQDGQDGQNGEPFNPDDAHFTDEDLDRAMADFEKEFNSSESADSQAGGQQTGNDGDLPDIGDIDIPTDASEIDASVGFEDELAGLLGNKAKVAVLVTRIASAELLAAFCQLSDISAECLGSNQGACAVLRNLDGDGPEAAARDLTTVVNGMSLILAVNRADKLEATLYMHGKAGQVIAPPILFTSTPRFVEDLTLGIVNIAQLKTQGFEIVDSASLSHDEAMDVLARHTRFGRGGATRGSRVE